ncbi:unnamed protein product [Cuscuta campestris]|uniref:Uncharacterized protein n=1 Tax=Cuscuta campestris TaxID=132261 RepID=A0A484LHY4_9ASTE|nr:unnamed protein product [Cuscuta campestris]
MIRSCSKSDDWASPWEQKNRCTVEYLPNLKVMLATDQLFDMSTIVDPGYVISLIRKFHQIDDKDGLQGLDLSAVEVPRRGWQQEKRPGKSAIREEKKPILNFFKASTLISNKQRLKPNYLSKLCCNFSLSATQSMVFFCIPISTLCQVFTLDRTLLGNPTTLIAAKSSAATPSTSGGAAPSSSHIRQEENPLVISESLSTLNLIRPSPSILASSHTWVVQPITRFPLTRPESSNGGRSVA